MYQYVFVSKLNSVTASILIFRPPISIFPCILTFTFLTTHRIRMRLLRLYANLVYLAAHLIDRSIITHLCSSTFLSEHVETLAHPQARRDSLLHGLHLQQQLLGIDRLQLILSDQGVGHIAFSKLLILIPEVCLVGLVFKLGHFVQDASVCQDTIRLEIQANLLKQLFLCFCQVVQIGKVAKVQLRVFLVK